MARWQDFERELTVATADLSPEAIAKKLAAVAIEARDRAIASGEASDNYDTFVNGREGAPESGVVPPGPILYLFSYGADIARFALETARQLSPIKSGRYRDAWFILVEGAQVDPSAVPANASFTLTNDEPYSRKIEIGAEHVSVPPHIVERVRSVVTGRFGNFIKARVRYIDLAGGYVLKRAHKTTGAGDVMTYPSLEISPR